VNADSCDPPAWVVAVTIADLIASVSRASSDRKVFSSATPFIVLWMVRLTLGGATGSGIPALCGPASGLRGVITSVWLAAPGGLWSGSRTMLRNATLPPFPNAMPQDKVRVTVQVGFPPF
jgi:hypothetical protein